jgi:uncharacterized membrane protein
MEKPFGLSEALERNIQALAARRAAERAAATRQERLAEAITRFSGSMLFVYLHLALVGGWVTINTGLTGVRPFDPSFVILATVASVEAIFLSTFVLISQNRMQAAADRRADLDLHISLLTEHEVTKLAELVSAIAERMGLAAARSPEMEEIKQNVVPEAVLDEIEAREGG